MCHFAKYFVIYVTCCTGTACSQPVFFFFFSLMFECFRLHVAENEVDRLGVGWEEADNRVEELELELDSLTQNGAAIRTEVYEANCQVCPCTGDNPILNVI